MTVCTKSYGNSSIGNYLLALAFAAVGDLEGALNQLMVSRMKNAVSGLGGTAGSAIKTIVGYVVMIFILFLFATSGLISNAQTQTQLKNGAYFAGNFSSVVAILLALDFIGL